VAGFLHKARAFHHPEDKAIPLSCALTFIYIAQNLQSGFLTIDVLPHRLVRR